MSQGIFPQPTIGLELLYSSEITPNANSFSIGNDLNPLFTSRFRNYRVVFSGNVTATLRLRLRSNVTDETSAQYRAAWRSFGSDGGSILIPSGSISNFLVASNQGTTRISMNMEIGSPAESENTTFYANGGYLIASGVGLEVHSGGALNTALPYNGLTIYLDSNGKFNTGCKIQVYGYEE